MTQFSIAGFYRIGIFFPLGNCIMAEVIPQTTVGIKGVAVIPFGFGGSVDHRLNGLLGAIPDHLPT